LRDLVCEEMQIVLLFRSWDNFGMIAWETTSPTVLGVLLGLIMTNRHTHPNQLHNHKFKYT
jgi:hypothetical protein